MSSALALWWLALPVLLLPIWWHRQKRQRTQAEPLATARFLPAAAPQQLPIWRWADLLLLALRLLLLLGVIAWLADVAVPMRGDTVFVGAKVDPVWVDAQILAAGLHAATRQDLPAADPWAWLAAHEREWQPGARLLIVATGDAVAMPAHAPALAHRVDLRLQPLVQGVQAAQSVAVVVPVEHHVVLASTRESAWRALFTAFESAGLGRDRYVMSTVPDSQTELIVWDRPGAPDAAWRAPLWWAVQPAAFTELAQAQRAGGVRVADGARGRIWAQDAWPLDAADPLPGARALFEDSHALQREPQLFAAPSMALVPGLAAPQQTPSGVAHPLLAAVLAALFALERLLAHWQRRRRQTAVGLPTQPADTASAAP